ncbi:protein SRG1-like [Silene latifolia]|uniref:protein SRG1-like n=1 Tax=Silene latifolia TaxID=37657 RepID=UPI003D7867FC
MEEATVLGKSILVPSVVELAKESNKLFTVPDRYVRNDLDDGPIIEQNQLDDHNNDDLHLPVIDLKGLINGDDVELRKLHLACQDWGFFQLVNHGVSGSLVEKVKLEIQEFFNLPIEEKKKYWQRADEIEGYGQAFVLSEEQKLDWADMFFLTTFPKHERKSRLFSVLSSSFRNALEDYSVETRKLTIIILECMEKALGIDSIRKAFGEGHQTMRMNYYPACPQPDKVIGLTPHSDAVGLTILLQINHMNGLQIIKNGKWHLVKPLDNAFVINVGDILEILSNGVYSSIMHRAVVNSSEARQSIATFYKPSLTSEIGPIPELITPETPAMFKRITMVDYWKGLFSRTLDGKAYLDSMRIDDTDVQPV